jgi:hypothetical protein
LLARTGWFVQETGHAPWREQPPRPRRLKRLRAIFFMAQPPALERRGVAPYRNQVISSSDVLKPTGSINHTAIAHHNLDTYGHNDRRCRSHCVISRLYVKSRKKDQDGKVAFMQRRLRQTHAAVSYVAAHLDEVFPLTALITMGPWHADCRTRPERISNRSVTPLKITRSFR